MTFEMSDIESPLEPPKSSMLLRRLFKCLSGWESKHTHIVVKNQEVTGGNEKEERCFH